MYKSRVVTFGFLLSTLVMLAVMPVLNQQNSFSNTVMAQEYDDYDDNKYSQYPTKENKYECRTGSFEGFFVSSVEFCKFKFDDKERKDSRDNRTGTQGPPGPAGPAGIPGPAGPQGEQGERGLTGATGMTGPAGEDGMDGTQGPRGFNGTDGAQGSSGITQLNDTNTYLVNPEPVFNNSTNSNVGQAICNYGDFVINGGFTLNGSVGGNANLVEFVNRPILSPLGSGWEVFIAPTTSTGEVLYSVYAICFDNSP